MKGFSYILLNIHLAYVTAFTLLGLFTYFTHIPKDTRFSGYRKSRTILSSAFFFMAAYCLLRFFTPNHQNDYLSFWLLAVASLTFLWLSYTAFLYLIDAKYSTRKNFLIDNILPIFVMLSLGVLGQFLPTHQKLFEILLGIVYITKLTRMFYVCEKEWQRVNKEQKEYFDEEIDIVWMRVLIWLTFLLCVCGLVALYSHIAYIIYEYLIPIVYAYMAFKIVNYIPTKIDEMRIKNITSTEDPEPEVTTNITPLKIANIAEKIGPSVERWVSEKNYCTPNLTIKDVAAQIGTNHNYLSQYINNCLNMTFQLWLNTLRIEESKHILTNENITIEEVGAKVGILESYNFSRWFKNVTGTTPFKYRKEKNLIKKSVS